MSPVATKKPNSPLYLYTPNTLNSSPIKPDVPGKPIEDKTITTNKNEKVGILLTKKL